ncbi:MAG: tetratricopeptide (TPR) repeat protein [Rhodothermales bacterium]
MQTNAGTRSPFAVAPHIPDTRFNRAVAIGLPILVVAIFANSFGNSFTNWDDQLLIVENSAIRNLSPAIFKPVAGETYQPVRVLSYAIDHALWGLNPFGYHLVNTALHALASVLLFFLVRGLLDALRSSQTAANRVMALLVAAAFAIHPINVEAVVWLSSRKYGLLAVFSFATLLLHLKGRPIPSATCLAFALLSSPFAIALPPLIFLLDWTRSQKPDWRRLWPLSVPVLALVPVIAYCLLGGSDNKAVKTHDGGLFRTGLEMLQAVADYAVNLLLPLFLNARYLAPGPQENLLSPKLLAGIAIVIALALWAICELRNRQRLPAFCVLWTFLAWLPVSNAVRISTNVADRYMYLAAIGLFLGGLLLLERTGRAALPICALAALAWAGLTLQRNRVWADSVSLWRDSIAKEPDNPLARNSLGLALRDTGFEADAGAHFQHAFLLAPGDGHTRLNLASHLQNTGRYDEAWPHLQRANELLPDEPKVLAGIGVHHHQSGDLPSAIAALKQAITLDADYAKAHDKLAVVHLAGGDLQAALVSCRRAVGLAPRSAEFRINLAIACDKLTLPEALGHAEAAVALAPDDPRIRAKQQQLQGLDPLADFLSRANAQRQAGDLDGARDTLLAAVEVQPIRPEPHRNLGDIFRRAGDIPRAISHFEASLAAQPAQPAVRTVLASLLHSSGRVADAHQHHLIIVRGGGPFAERVLLGLAQLPATPENQQRLRKLQGAAKTGN